ncbi:tRNA methyltransferase, has a role in tRNA modification [Entomophthora muscae]|uniref:tRNA methyltransferase, has a role in tRNA modification n=1 Tax=Entomophthora muscae TaxID=34485 RepID=A0ACC2TTC1_9FUNG|nr:tRNA methyltransferase, has a role in tRNA modification [Entomophthora muscae]
MMPEPHNPLSKPQPQPFDVTVSIPTSTSKSEPTEHISVSEEAEFRKKEEIYVHQVYQTIAPHFSNTRFKPWPVVEKFLKELPPGSIGADVGCGNGKYLGVNPSLITLGSDRCFNLVEISKERGHEALVADNLNLPYRSNCFDFIISIAVIHHFTTPSRREQAIQELSRVLRPGGKMLVFVWALEQKGKRQFDPNAPDVLVPWVLPQKFAPGEKPEGTESQVYQRYYHLFQEGELEQLAISAPLDVLDHGYDRDNWWGQFIKRTPNTN